MNFELTRRSFLGGILATACAPAIVRASSLMILPRQADWTEFVRELVAYDINTDSMIHRLDLYAPGVGQWYVNGNARQKEAMLEHLKVRLFSEKLRTSQLAKLPMPPTYTPYNVRPNPVWMVL